MSEAEVSQVLKGLLRSLTEVRRQRLTFGPDTPEAEKELRRREAHGLNIAIGAIRRRIR